MQNYQRLLRLDGFKVTPYHYLASSLVEARSPPSRTHPDAEELEGSFEGNSGPS